MSGAATGETPLPWMYHDGGRESAKSPYTGNDCVIRSIAIVTDEPYDEVQSKVRKIGVHSTAEIGVDVSHVSRLLLGGEIFGTWKLVQGGGAELTAEGLEKPIRDHSKLLVELQIPEMRGRDLYNVGHLTALIEGVVHDIDGMRDPATGNARICPVVSVYAPG
ncbi:hypothetical protein ACRU43_16915 [Mycobacterium colombiense]